MQLVLIFNSQILWLLDLLRSSFLLYWWLALLMFQSFWQAYHNPNNSEFKTYFDYFEYFHLIESSVILLLSIRWVPHVIWSLIKLTSIRFVNKNQPSLLSNSPKHFRSFNILMNECSSLMFKWCIHSSL